MAVKPSLGSINGLHKDYRDRDKLTDRQLIKSTGTPLNPRARFRTCIGVKQISQVSVCFSHQHAFGTLGGMRVVTFFIMVDNKQTSKPPSDIGPDNIIPITLDKLTPEQMLEYEQMMNNLKSQCLHSFKQTRSGTVIQRYKLKMVPNDDSESGTSKDGKAKGDKANNDEPKDEAVIPYILKDI
uniref:Uncharacterized protein n=1 Tax=Oryza sativa subsp. japonica TaxID=39947 RepID=Q6YT82_ORYSJ|nr:hypothetical protein [Oryza sativa Japonica Group]BAD31386.1 hypothetical protein [Oryza sativa Japonica Group]